MHPGVCLRVHLLCRESLGRERWAIALRLRTLTCSPLRQTSEASERCLDGKRKTLNGEDVLDALTALGFDNYVRPSRKNNLTTADRLNGVATGRDA